MDFAVPAVHRTKLKESEKKDKYPELARILKKTVDYESSNYTNRDVCFWYSHQKNIKGVGGLGNNWKTGVHPNYYIIENGQNTEKSPGDLRRLVVT